MVSWVSAALFAISEIGLRLFTDPGGRWYIRIGAGKQFDPVARFRNKPFVDQGDGTRTNELGYRAPLQLAFVVRPAGALRVLYLGDSNSVIPTDNYPKQVERLLEAELGIPVETVSTGADGEVVRGYVDPHFAGQRG